MTFDTGTVFDPPTRDEIERVRKLYDQWIDDPDHLTSSALVWQIPRLLARIEHLEALLTLARQDREQAEQARTGLRCPE